MVLALAVLVLALAAPAGAQSFPPCGSAQWTPRLEFDVSPQYAGHTYGADLIFEISPGDREFPDNLQLSGPPGVVGRVSPDTERIRLTPQPAGTVTLNMSWDQRGTLDMPGCSASTTLDIPVLEALPLVIEPERHGRSAYYAGFHRGGFGIVFSLVPGDLPEDGAAKDVADLTPVRVEARAVSGMKRPGSSVEPAVLEYVPGARQPRRAERGLVTIVRRDFGTIEVLVAAREGTFRRGLSVTLSQGARRIGSFAATGRCHSSNSFGLVTGACDFRGRHAWLWAPCRKAVLIRGRFYGCAR